MGYPVVHFEIPADDTARAKRFYETLFGWKITYMKDYDYFMIIAKDNGVGIDGGMMKRKMPKQPFANYITVPSIDVILKKAVANGAKVCMPRTPIGMGAIGAFIDTEGNFIGVHEAPKTVAPVKTAVKKAAKKSTAKKKKK